MAKKGSKRLAKNQSQSNKKNKKNRRPNINISTIKPSQNPIDKKPEIILAKSNISSTKENQETEIFGNNISKNLKFETRKFSLITVILVAILIILSFIL
ncbi:MAG: hypothetical protein CL764_01100 [Chloroflexi bacterium]|nr:hypothetical protein [Chloroflexota bacterium]|tara:strand:- start:471 stop:767 length:297 start_codon:yes stop_codon:yes gene_type:complete